MNSVKTYLKGLQSSVFKLLPMREDYDAGVDNHIAEFLAHLEDGMDGALVAFNELSSSKKITQVRSNIALLGANVEMDFAKWRNTVLRSTRLVGLAIEELCAEVEQ